MEESAKGLGASSGVARERERKREQTSLVDTNLSPDTLQPRGGRRKMMTIKRYGKKKRTIFISQRELKHKNGIIKEKNKTPVQNFLFLRACL